MDIFSDKERLTQCKSFKVFFQKVILWSIGILMCGVFSIGMKAWVICWYWEISWSPMLLSTQARNSQTPDIFLFSPEYCPNFWRHLNLFLSFVEMLMNINVYFPLQCNLSEVSYAQGMNDLCSRFLEVLDSEVDTYWSFCCYMEKFSRDFCADGLHRKIGGFL